MPENILDLSDNFDLYVFDKKKNLSGNREVFVV